MTQISSNAGDSEIFSPSASMRQTELAGQHWNRSKSEALAKSEGISLNDEQWAVLVYLRRYYLEHGLPRHARTTASALDQHFSAQGGNKYLYRLFAGGPVTQGSRLANLRTPADATDGSFGNSYGNTRLHDGCSGETAKQINREVGNMSDMRFSQVQGAQYKGGTGEKPGDKSAALAEVRDGCDSGQKTPEGTAPARRDESDRQAIERGEDEGMMVPHSMNPGLHKKGQRANAVTER